MKNRFYRSQKSIQKRFGYNPHCICPSFPPIISVISRKSCTFSCNFRRIYSFDRGTCTAVSRIFFRLSPPCRKRASDGAGKATGKRPANDRLNRRICAAAPVPPSGKGTHCGMQKGKQGANKGQAKGNNVRKNKKAKKEKEVYGHTPILMHWCFITAKSWYKSIRNLYSFSDCYIFHQIRNAK